MRFLDFVLPLSTSLAIINVAGAALNTDLGVRGVAQPQVQADITRITSHRGCIALTRAFSNSVFYKGSNVYTYESGDFWSLTEILSPSCVFRPTSAQQIGTAVTLLAKTQTNFAVRGGGHMGITAANNVDNGVLIVMSNLTTFELNADRSILSVGPSYRWGDVYARLEPYGLAVQGGRLSPIGVPGLLLGGGISFYGNARGFACDDVVNFEIVLADGSVHNANGTTNADLFFSLKGGSSNFGIVTRFDLQTFPAAQVWAGTYTVDAAHIPALLEATANYSLNSKDPKSACITAVISTDPPVGATIIFYDSATETFPTDLQPFTKIPSISSTLARKPLKQFTDETATIVVPDLNDVFASGTIAGNDFQSLAAGIKDIYDIFNQRIPLLYAAMPKENIMLIEINWEPITKLWLTASAKKGGNALGLSGGSDGSKVYVCYAQAVEWTGAQYNPIVYNWVSQTAAAITDQNKAEGVYDPFHYMGDSAGFQIPGYYDGYGQGNGAKLLATSRKYDKHRIFQDLMPGGFKLGK